MKYHHYELLDRKDIGDKALLLYRTGKIEELKDLVSQYPQYKGFIQLIISFYEQLRKATFYN